MGHPIEKRFIFKENIMDLDPEGMILVENENENSNLVSITFGSHDPTTLYKFVEVHNCDDVLASLT